MNEPQSTYTPRTLKKAGKPAPTKRRFDIQILRFLSILLVIGNHYFSDVVTGGYIGVDVFFVISGFLIIGHLAESAGKKGHHFSLKQFYLKRIRRLLPAAFVTLLVVYLLVLAFIPNFRLKYNAYDFVASTFYVENWSLIYTRIVNYSQPGVTASVFQHFWSLSVEEQFYFLFPLIVLILVKFKKTNYLFVITGILFCLSLGYSIYYTPQDPVKAYFFSPIRFWELMLGGLIYFIGKRVKIKLPNNIRFAIQVILLISITLSSTLFTENSIIPGYICLIPTALAGLFILIGSSALNTIYKGIWRAPRYIGDASYSLYLWHWPVYMLLPYIIGALGIDSIFIQQNGDITNSGKYLALLISSAIAIASYELIEKKASSNAQFMDSKFAIVFVTSFSLAAAMLGYWSLKHANNEMKLSQEVNANYMSQVSEDCKNPYKLSNKLSQCSNLLNAPVNQSSLVDGDYTPAVRAWKEYPQCNITAEIDASIECDFSDGKDSAPITFVGDSHIQQWQKIIIEIAKQQKKKLVGIYISGCPVGSFSADNFPTSPFLQNKMGDCSRKNSDAFQYLAKLKPSQLFYSNSALSYPAYQPQKENINAQASKTSSYSENVYNYLHNFQEQTGAEIIIINDPPSTKNNSSGINCLATHQMTIDSCKTLRKDVTSTKLMDVSKLGAPDNFKIIDLTDAFCDDTYCYPMLNGHIVYYDKSHLSYEMIKDLQPEFLQKYTQVQNNNST